jgi:chemotaxis methyl-accepting protein methylase
MEAGSTMQNLLPLSARFRHVVVARGSRARRRIVDCAGTDRPTEIGAEDPASEPGEHQQFCRWLFDLVGLDARNYRSETLRRRLPACLRELRVRTIGQARRELELKPALCTAAVSTILVGVTTFFRDAGVFGTLRDQLPQLAGNRRGVSVWSVGCSNGEELYSIALLLAELGLLRQSYLLGTDCRADAIEQARRASYDAMSMKNVPAALRDRYFVRDGQRWRLEPQTAVTARFRVEDALRVHQPGIWDLIMCRNTTMYMRPEATSPLWERFESSLRAGGLLVLGKAERPLGAKRLALVAPCIYRKLRA